LVEKLFDEQRTLVIATAGEGAWAAPVYALYREARFYFFSSPESRHIREAGALCAASVFRETGDWDTIEGAQMEGSIQECTDGDGAAILEAYYRKFPTAVALAGGALALDEFQARFRARLYEFRPLRIFYLNNRAGFGRRQEVPLQDLWPSTGE
jgi:uncharacterized protein YhbP (UPF0306 family)